MNKEDLESIGAIGIILGGIILFAGLQALSYEDVNIGADRITYPYAQFAPFLLIPGIVVFVIGIFMLGLSVKARLP